MTAGEGARHVQADQDVNRPVIAVLCGTRSGGPNATPSGAPPGSLWIRRVRG